MTDLEKLERRVQNEMGWSPVMLEVFEALRRRDEALRQIASCESVVPGDVVDIARRAIS